jgi:hypothetical protein
MAEMDEGRGGCTDDRADYLMERYNALRWLQAPDCDEDAPASVPGRDYTQDALMAAYNQ